MDSSWPFADPATLDAAVQGLLLVVAAMSVLWLISLRLRDANRRAR